MAEVDYVLANKPSGLASHRVSPEKPGFCEWLEKKLSRQLYIAHRLDKETSGCMILATSPESAARLTEEFSARRMRKKYFFITDRKPAKQEWVSESEIRKDGKVMTSKTGEANSRTEFRIVKNHEKFFLIEARPCTGKTHQIRLHARDSQVPLLGDTAYGGSAFPHFFLHSCELESQDKSIAHATAWPLIYDRLDLLKRPMLCQWLMSYDRRQRLYPELIEGDQCVRLVHNEGTPLRADKLGDVVHAGWWHERAPTAEQLDDIRLFFSLVQIPKWFLQHYKKQKSGTSGPIHSSAPSVWRAHENGARFEFQLDVGNAPGLFLDQRRQRLWVKENSRDLRVLNLFAYTGGFSVMAALGGAASVVTVDLSKKYLEWAKQNFRLNDLTPEDYKFYDMDAQEYLKFAQKKQHTYDLIICDPPSFSRNGNQTFQIERDFKTLIQKMKALLSPTGLILFSTNFEHWDVTTWEQALEPLCRTERLEFSRVLNWQWDFEVDPTQSLMKAFQLKQETMD